MNWITDDNKFTAPVYKKYPITLVKGEGNHVWDDLGKQYLDLYGGHAVCVLGHGFPSVVEAITRQAQTLMFYSNIVHTTPSIELAEALVGTLAPEPYRVYFSNSGSEANEAAIKAARKLTGKKNILSFNGSFHGRAITTLAVTGIDSYHRYEPNLDEYTRFATLGDMDSVRAAYDDDTAAVICESIQSIGGVHYAEPEFYQELERFCEEKGILLIFDEVQTGIGRTGHFWAAQAFGVSPDIITSAKGIANGLPLSAVIFKQSVAAQLDLSDHATTFGGGPVPCAAGLAVVQTVHDEAFLKDVREKSELFQSKLRALPHVTSVRGQGFLLAFELEKTIPDLVTQLLENGLIIGGSAQENTYRLTPSLTITREEIDQAITILSAILSPKP